MKIDTFSSNYIRITTSTDLGTEGIIGQRKDGALKFSTPQPPFLIPPARKWGIKLSNLKNTDFMGGFLPFFIFLKDSPKPPLYEENLKLLVQSGIVGSLALRLAKPTRFFQFLRKITDFTPESSFHVLAYFM